MCSFYLQIGNSLRFLQESFIDWRTDRETDWAIIYNSFEQQKHFFFAECWVFSREMIWTTMMTHFYEILRSFVSRKGGFLFQFLMARPTEWDRLVRAHLLYLYFGIIIRGYEFNEFDRKGKHSIESRMRNLNYWRGHSKTTFIEILSYDFFKFYFCM